VGGADTLLSTESTTATTGSVVVNVCEADVAVSPKAILQTTFGVIIRSGATNPGR
ncbi:hypothetical protein F444_16927, partial [Phytophthora nicotianae P1976]